MLYTNKPKGYDQFVAAMRYHDHLTAGERFGSLVSTAYKRPGRRSAIWTWGCDCGEPIVMAAQYVLDEGASDCGCGCSHRMSSSYEAVTFPPRMSLHRSVTIARRYGIAAAVRAIIKVTRAAF